CRHCWLTPAAALAASTRTTDRSVEFGRWSDGQRSIRHTPRRLRLQALPEAQRCADGAACGSPLPGRPTRRARTNRLFFAEQVLTEHRAEECLECGVSYCAM